ncbi:MAG: DnaD domain-containing protein [Dehalococcoidia bacterium]
MTLSSKTDPQQASKRFEGYPAGARATVVPSAFFSELMPLIEDASELRVTLYLFYALGRRHGYPRFVTERELRAEGPLLASLGDGGDVLPLQELAKGVALAVERGSILRLEVEQNGTAEALLTTNTPANRRAFQQIRLENMPVGRTLPPEAGAPASQRENVFKLYEANIGPLTPLVAEELKEAEQLYPYEWLEEALKEAALQNKRSWRYAAAILQRWATEGRTRETAGRAAEGATTARSQILDRYRRQLSGD